MDSEPLTLRNLITNPPGKNTHQVGARYMLRDALTAKFRETFADPARRKRYGLQVSPAGPDSFCVWVKVPSEKYSLDYDVVFLLTFDEGVRSAMGARVQLYCNSPGWVMPVGYVAAKSGLLIPGWEKALGRAATDAPGTINPSGDYGFDKTTFRAILYLSGPGGLLTRSDLERSKKSKPPKPGDPAMSAEAKLFEYGRAREKAAEAARLAKKVAKKAAEAEASDERKKASAASGAKRAAKSVKAASSAKIAKTARNSGGKTR